MGKLKVMTSLTQSTTLPHCNLQGNKRLFERQALLNKGSRLIELYLAGGGHDLTPVREAQQVVKQAKRQFNQTQRVKDLKPTIPAQRIQTHWDRWLTAHQTFAQPEIWAMLSEKTTTLAQKNKLSQLKRQWFKQKHYTHFTDDTLFKISKEYAFLQRLLTDTKKAAKKTYQHRPKHHQTLRSYLSYCARYERAIHKERKALTETLFFRIKRYVEGDHTDPLNQLTHTLHTMGLPVTPLNAEFTPPVLPFPLARAIAYCQRHGKPDLVAALTECLTLTDTLKLNVITQRNRQLLVPDSLALFIPKQPAFFGRLARNHQQRYHFLLPYQSLLAALGQLKKSFPTPSWPLDDAYLSPLDALIPQLDQALSNNDRALGKRLNSQKSKAMLTAWKQTLTDAKRSVIDKQLVYLQALAATEQPLPYASVRLVGTDLETHEDLDNLLKRIETHSAALNDTDLIKHVASVKKALYRRLLPIQASHYFDKVLSQLNQHGWITEKTLTDFISEWGLPKAQYQPAFIQAYEQALPSLLASLRTQLTTLSHELNVNERIAPSLGLTQITQVFQVISQATERTPDVTDIIPDLANTLQVFREFTKRQSPQNLMNTAYRSLFQDLKNLIYSHSSFTTLYPLLETITEYQTAIAAGQHPQTLKEQQETLQHRRQHLREEVKHSIEQTDVLLHRFQSLLDKKSGNTSFSFAHNNPNYSPLHFQAAPNNPENTTSAPAALKQEGLLR